MVCLPGWFAASCLPCGVGGGKPTPGSVGGRAGDCSAYRPALAGGGAFSLYKTPPLLAAPAALSKRDSQGVGFGGSDGPASAGPITFPPKPSRQEKPARIDDCRLGGLLRLAEGRAQQSHPNLDEASQHKGGVAVIGLLLV